MNGAQRIILPCMRQPVGVNASLPQPVDVDTVVGYFAPVAKFPMYRYAELCRDDLTCLDRWDKDSVVGQLAKALQPALLAMAGVGGVIGLFLLINGYASGGQGCSGGEIAGGGAGEAVILGAAYALHRLRYRASSEKLSFYAPLTYLLMRDNTKIRWDRFVKHFLDEKRARVLAGAELKSLGMTMKQLKNGERPAHPSGRPINATDIGTIFFHGNSPEAGYLAQMFWALRVLGRPLVIDDVRPESAAEYFADLSEVMYGSIAAAFHSASSQDFNTLIDRVSHYMNGPDPAVPATAPVPAVAHTSFLAAYYVGIGRRDIAEAMIESAASVMLGNFRRAYEQLVSLDLDAITKDMGDVEREGLFALHQLGAGLIMEQYFQQYNPGGSKDLAVAQRAYFMSAARGFEFLQGQVDDASGHLEILQRTANRFVG